MAQITINNLTTQSSGFSDFWIPVCDNNGNTYKVKVKDLIGGSGASSASVAPIVKTAKISNTRVSPYYAQRGHRFVTATINETNMFASSTVISGTIGDIPISKSAGSSTIVFGTVSAAVNGAKVNQRYGITYGSGTGNKGIRSSPGTIHITCTTNSLKIEANQDLSALINIYKAG